MTMTPEPRYWRVFAKDRHPLEDKTPESEIYVGFSDYNKAVRQQERCAGQTANEWRALWVQQAKQDAAKGVEIEMLKIAIQALQKRGGDLWQALYKISEGTVMLDHPGEYSHVDTVMAHQKLAERAIRAGNWPGNVKVSPDGSTAPTWEQDPAAGHQAPCACKGHPFNCVDHPDDCPCSTASGGAVNE